MQVFLGPKRRASTLTREQGIINKTTVLDIKWIPGSENLFMAAHMDGCLVVYDKEKEDAIFTSEEGEAQQKKAETYDASQVADNPKIPKPIYRLARLRVFKSVYSKNQKSNPVAFWKLSNSRINAFALSPDNRHLAVVCEDSSFRIFDYLKEE